MATEVALDWDLIDSFLVSGSPGTEVARHYGINEETLYKRVQKKFNMGFSEYLHQKRATGDALIRRKQYDKALGTTDTGDNTLLIWLGKIRLRQSEIPMEAAPHQEGIDYVAEIARLQAELALLKASKNANE